MQDLVNDSNINKHNENLIKDSDENSIIYLTESIIDAFRAGKNAVVHLTALKTETAVRVLDMLSGAIYALDGGVYEMEKNMDEMNAIVQRIYKETINA